MYIFTHQKTSTIRIELAAIVPTLLWRGVKMSASLGRRTTQVLKEQECSELEQNTLLIEGFMYGLSLHSYFSERKNQRLV